MNLTSEASLTNCPCDYYLQTETLWLFLGTLLIIPILQLQSE